MSMEAGRGEHHVYRILPAGQADQAKLTARNHYVSVDAVSWYVNKESGWFSDRMASGTLNMELAAGHERYQIGLGTFELEHGAHVAPVFDRPALPERNYRGGPITVRAHLSGIRRDNALGGILRSAAGASLGIVKGMVETAALAGPAAPLAAAGRELIDGVSGVLTVQGDGREPLFDDAGLEFSIHPEEIVGPEVYFLFHRGTDLDDTYLAVGEEGQIAVPLYGDALLADGAWLLVRVRRDDEYSGIRPWMDALRGLNGRISDLVTDVCDGFTDLDTGKAEFEPSSGGNKTLFDEYARLRAVIREDGVLSEREAGLVVGQLRNRFTSAKKAVERQDESVYTGAVNGLKDALARGERAPAGPAEEFEDEVVELAETRLATLAVPVDSRRVATLRGDDLFETMRWVPMALDRVAAV